MHTHTHTHPFNGPFSGTTRVGRYQKGKTNLDLLKQEIVSGSGSSWAICKSAPRSRQITTPAPHHSVFYRPEALPAAQRTASKHWRSVVLNIEKIFMWLRKLPNFVVNSQKACVLLSLLWLWSHQMACVSLFITIVIVVVFICKFYVASIVLLSFCLLFTVHYYMQF